MANQVPSKIQNSSVKSTFTLLKEFDPIIVKTKGCDYEIHCKVTIKSNDRRPTLLLTKVYRDAEGNIIESTKLGRILHTSLDQLVELIRSAQFFISDYILAEKCKQNQNHGNLS